MEEEIRVIGALLPPSHTHIHTHFAGESSDVIIPSNEQPFIPKHSGGHIFYELLYFSLSVPGMIPHQIFTLPRDDPWVLLEFSPTVPSESFHRLQPRASYFSCYLTLTLQESITIII